MKTLEEHLKELWKIQEPKSPVYMNCTCGIKFQVIHDERVFCSIKCFNATLKRRKQLRHE